MQALAGQHAVVVRSSPGRQLLAAGRTRPARPRSVLAPASALSAQELQKRALKLDEFDGSVVQGAVARLRSSLGSDAQACDDASLDWFLRDRKLDVEKTVSKVRAYLQWRADFTGLTAEAVAREAATGKARLLRERDVLGRPTVVVKVALNKVDERVLADTERLCVFLMDQALEQMLAEGRTQTILTVFDLRGFNTKNADLPFIRFFIKLMFDIYPKRIGQVLLVGAPLLFQPLWQVVKPLLGNYASLVQFVSADEAAGYFAMSGALDAPVAH